MEPRRGLADHDFPAILLDAEFLIYMLLVRPGVGAALRWVQRFLWLMALLVMCHLPALIG